MDGSPNEALREQPIAIIALDFCEALIASLDEFQLRAVAVARLYWDHGNTEQLAAVLKESAKRVDSDGAEGGDIRKIACNRLVWTALNRNTKLDEYSCEYVVLLAADAGLKIGEVTQVLAKHLPGLESTG